MEIYREEVIWFKMNIKIVNNDKNKVKYNILLTVFYGLICFVSIRGIIAFFTGHFLKTSQITYIPLTKWTFQMLLNYFIWTIITILSIIIIVLVIKKKLPKFNLVFPIYYLLFLLFWNYIIPHLTWPLANSVEELVQLEDNQDQYLIIHLIIEFVFSSWFLLKLWNAIKGGKNK